MFLEIGNVFALVLAQAAILDCSIRKKIVTLFAIALRTQYEEARRRIFYEQRLERLGIYSFHLLSTEQIGIYLLANSTPVSVWGQGSEVREYMIGLKKNY